MTSNLRSTGRLAYLDGLRGIAALVVVIFHFCSAYVSNLIPTDVSKSLWVSDTPISILYNGRFAVIIFFVLSGLVVSNSAVKRSSPIGITLLLRYLRLAVPATISVIFAWALLSAFPNEARTLNAISTDGWLSFTYQDNIPPLASAIYNGMFGVFFSGTSMFNNVLWTMQIELIGSCAIYIIYFFVFSTNIRVLILIFIGIVLTPSHQGIYEGFVAGSLLSEVWASGNLRTFLPKTLFIVGVLIGSTGDGFHERYHLPHVPRSLMLGEGSGLLYPLAASLIVYACMTSLLLQNILSSLIPKFLGRISFSLYLYHVPFLYTLFAVWYMHILPHSNCGLVLLLMMYLTFCLGVAYCATLGVDEPTVRAIANLRKNLGRISLGNVRLSALPLTRS